MERAEWIHYDVCKVCGKAMQRLEFTKRAVLMLKIGDVHSRQQLSKDTRDLLVQIRTMVRAGLRPDPFKESQN